MSQPTVYVLLLNWNGWPDTIECLESIFRIDYPELRVVVCDNGSDDDSVERIRAWADGRELLSVSSDSPRRELTYPPVAKPIQYTVRERSDAEQCASAEAKLTIILNGENLGFAGGCNVGIRVALDRGADYIWLLNNDTVVADTQVLRHLIGASGQHAIASTVTLDYRTGDVWFGGGKMSKLVAGPVHYRKRRSEDVFQTRFISGCNMFIPADFLRETGLLDERFFFGMEDCLLCHRATRSCLGLKVVNRDAVYHKIGRANRLSEFAIANSYVCKCVWIRMCLNKALVPLWVAWFVLSNVLIRVPCKLIHQRIRRHAPEIGIMRYWAIAFRSLLVGLRVTRVSPADVRAILLRPFGRNE